MRISIFGVTYLIIGLVVASTHNYLGNLGINHLSRDLSAVLAIIGWPLIYLGADLHLHLANHHR